MALNPGMAVSLIVAVSFAAGINVYATILTLGVAARMGWGVPSGLHLLADPWVLGASAVLFAGGFVADKIPGFDLVWNAAHTFIRVPLATLMAFGAASHLSPEMQALATVLGGAVAMLAHSSKTAARILVTPSPEPISNIALSTVEDAGVVALTGIALKHPGVAAMVAAALSAGSIVLVVVAAKVLRRMGRGMWGRVCEVFGRRSTA